MVKEEMERRREQDKEMTKVEPLNPFAGAPDEKPTIEELEKAIGTPDEMDILPDGSVQPKHKTALTGDIKPSVGNAKPPCVGSDDFKEDCLALRSRIEETKVQTMLVFNEHPVFRSMEGVYVEAHISGQFGEMKANLKLAYRHLEDAKMRLGKAIQAFDGGKSIYPR